MGSDSAGAEPGGVLVQPARVSRPAPAPGRVPALPSCVGGPALRPPARRPPRPASFTGRQHGRTYRGGCSRPAPREDGVTQHSDGAPSPDGWGGEASPADAPAGSPREAPAGSLPAKRLPARSPKRRLALPRQRPTRPGEGAATHTLRRVGTVRPRLRVVRPRSATGHRPPTAGTVARPQTRRRVGTPPPLATAAQPNPATAAQPNPATAAQPNPGAAPVTGRYRLLPVTPNRPTRARLLGARSAGRSTSRVPAGPPPPPARTTPPPEPRCR